MKYIKLFEEFISEESILEMDFKSEEDFKIYSQKHKIRAST